MKRKIIYVNFNKKKRISGFTFFLISTFEKLHHKLKNLFSKTSKVTVTKKKQLN